MVNMVNERFFYHKKIGIVIKLHARIFTNISRVQIIRLSLNKKDYLLSIKS